MGEWSMMTVPPGWMDVTSVNVYLVEWNVTR